jgi:ERCC4-related helicase
MRIIPNVGDNRVIDVLRASIAPGARLDIGSPALSLFAFAELRPILTGLEQCRVITRTDPSAMLQLTGGDADRPARNQLRVRWLAQQCARWIENGVELRVAKSGIPQAVYVADHPTQPTSRCVITGACSFTTDGLGLTPADQLGLVQCTETAEEAATFGSWFGMQWERLPASQAPKEELLAQLREIAAHKAPALVYHLVLYHLFKDLGDELDEERIVKSATGVRDSVIWKKLYKFQRDAVVGAIDKLERLGGCIIADSVGLGKTFEALAVIKYYELRNDRVLVLCPKRLRDNWTLYKANDRRNVLAADRLHYDVLNHTDLSREDGTSGDIDLSHVNWGNYDLVVIDESHNFRNKGNHRDRDTRYDRLMKRIIKAGVRTRVLMLSATPVNSRLADLKNQIAFATEGDDTALLDHGIPSIEETVRRAQAQFNRWLTLDDSERKPAALMDLLPFDYFKLLDLLTIARSRKHVQKYYGTAETGEFPERRKPVNIKAEVDLAAEFPPIRDINTEIRRLTLAAYAPLRYVLPHKQAAYDAKYSVTIRGGESVFRQADREESLVHLMRINLLKRMESSVVSFALTLQRQLAHVDAVLAKLANHADSVEEVDIDDVEVDDPAFETLLVGRNVKVLLQDVDRLRWRQDLTEDRNRIATLLAAAREIGPERDAKLEALREVIARKCREPINPGNRKVLVFTAFADTAEYVYRELAPWAHTHLGVHSALVTGAGRNRTNVPGLRPDLASVLTAFAPRSKERPPDLANELEIDLIFATDCISEGQNLQDCDFLVNYDIHWNPVRIIQRFGRVDRIGSPNSCVQLVNFWPNIELEEYINLEQRVSGRMVLLDISATGEENIIEQQSGDQMNDLEYRRRQLQQLQDAVIDLEDLSSGISIADLTLNDFRIDLARYLAEHPGRLERLPLGTFAVSTTHGEGEAAIPPGVIFCLRAAGESAGEPLAANYPLAPHYLVHVGEDGAVLLPFTQAKQILDRLKRLAVGRDWPDAEACRRFDRETRDGEDMSAVRRQLAAAVASVIGRKEERAAASLFTPGGTHALKGEFRGIDDFEVVAYLVALPAPSPA